MDMENSSGSRMLSSILTVSGIVIIVVNMFLENIPAYVGIGLALVVLGVIVHFMGESEAERPE